MRNIIIFLFLLITPLKAENVFPLDPAINYGKLENGLTYYIRENSSPKDKVVMRLFIKTGSVMEEEHQGLVSSLPKRGDQDLCAEEDASKMGQGRGALMTADLLS